MPTRRAARARRPRAMAPISSRSRSCSCAAIRPRTWCSSRRSRPPAAPRSRSSRARPPTAARPLLIGTPWVEDGKLYNAYCLLDGGAIAAVRFKVNLPNYGVFDERRVFAPGPLPGPINFRGVRHRHPDLRGHLDRLGRLRERGRVPGRDRRRTPDRAERLALLARQGRRAAQRRGRARHRERACR